MSQEKAIYFFLPDLEWFITMIYNAELEMKGFLENIIEKGRLLNIYFVGVIGLDNIQMINFYKVYEYFVKYKTGVHFGGNVEKNNIYNFNAVPYKEQSKMLKPGIGMISNRLSGEVDQIVIPLARR